MAVVNELTKGIWFVHFFTKKQDASATVRCGQSSVQLNLHLHKKLKLTLNEIEGEEIGPRLRRVRAFHNGDMKRLSETSPGRWAAEPWTFDSNLKFESYYDFSDDSDDDDDRPSAACQLVLEFKGDTSFEKGRGERRVLTQLSELLDTQLMVDVTFVVKKKTIGAHTAIVSQSPVICTMLEKDKFIEGRSKVVEVEDIEPSVFKEVLRYLYTGKAPKLDEDDMTEPLFQAADKYQIEALKNLCEQRLIKKLKLATAVHYLELADLYTAPQLLDASKNFLKVRKNQVVTRPEWKKLKLNRPDLVHSVKFLKARKKEVVGSGKWKVEILDNSQP